MNHMKNSSFSKLLKLSQKTVNRAASFAKKSDLAISTSFRKKSYYVLRGKKVIYRNPKFTQVIKFLRRQPRLSKYKRVYRK